MEALGTGAGACFLGGPEKVTDEPFKAGSGAPDEALLGLVPGLPTCLLVRSATLT